MPAYADFVAMTRADAAEALAGFLGDQQWSLDRFASTIDRELTF